MPVKAEFQADFKSFNDGIDQADKKLAQFGTTATKVSGQTKQWSTAMSQADSVLSKAGINIGPTTKALDELTSAAGKSVKDLGALATAGLVVGTAMAAWNIGRAVADFFKLDEAIGNATARLLGYGDVVAETAGAKQDTINAAIRNGAAATISYSAAIQYNIDFHKKRIVTVNEGIKADEKTKEAMIELNSAGASTQKTLAGINGTVVEAVKYYLEAGVAQSTLATAYGLTAVQVKAIAEAIKAADAADKAWLEGMKAAAAEADAFANIMRDLAKDAIEKTAKADERATAALTAKTDAIKDTILKNGLLKVSTEQAYVPTDALTAAWMKMNKELAELDKQKKGDVDVTASQQQVYDTYTQTLYDEAIAQDKAAEAARKAKEGTEKKTEAIKEATKQTGVFMQQLHMLINDPQIAGFFGFDAKGAVAKTLYGFGNDITPEMAAARAAGQFINTAGVGSFQRRASGGPVTGGHPYLVGEQGPELFVPSAGGSILPRGGAATVNNTFYVNGSAADVARTISAEIMRTMKAGSKVGAS